MEGHEPQLHPFLAEEAISERRAGHREGEGALDAFGEELFAREGEERPHPSSHHTGVAIVVRIDVLLSRFQAEASS